MYIWKKAEKQLINDEIIAPLIDIYGECTIEKSNPENYFDDMIETIVGQQLSMMAANSILDKFKRGIGESGGKFKPESILSKSDEELKSYGLSNQKIKYVRDLSDKVKRGEINLKKTDKMGNMEVVEYLTQVKGVGFWTADMFLMFSLARQDVFPSGDLGIRKAILKHFPDIVSRDDMVKVSNRWSPYRTLASWYLWKGLDNDAWRGDT